MQRADSLQDMSNSYFNTTSWLHGADLFAHTVGAESAHHKALWLSVSIPVSVSPTFLLCSACWEMQRVRPPCISLTDSKLLSSVVLAQSALHRSIPLSICNHVLCCYGLPQHRNKASTMLHLLRFTPAGLYLNRNTHRQKWIDLSRLRNSNHCGVTSYTGIDVLGATSSPFFVIELFDLEWALCKQRVCVKKGSASLPSSSPQSLGAFEVQPWPRCIPDTMILFGKGQATCLVLR